MTIKKDLTLDELFTLCATRIKQTYTSYLTNIPSLELKAAMAYTLDHQGKYIRPMLIYATGFLFDAPLSHLDIPATAVELIHTYSLIHDDLPAMDDADLRRGKPSCHKQFGEGAAILTGDALHTLAMTILASHPASLSKDKRIDMLQVLTHACGPYGMASGQMFDISIMHDQTLSKDLLTDIYQLKTGMLISACLQLGRLASKDDDEQNQISLKRFGDYLGLAFQIQDDILDEEVSEVMLGKPNAMDLKNHKMTYPRHYGIPKAKEKVAHLYEHALDTINHFMDKAYLLRALTQWIFERKK